MVCGADEVLLLLQTLTGDGLTETGTRMGLIRFAVFPADRRVDATALQRGYLSGMDGRIYPTQIDVADQVVTCRRASSESCKFYVPWDVPGIGTQVLNTTSLPEREAPYLLAVELTRGKLVQVRNQAGAWELAGMVLPGEYGPLVTTAHRLFGRAASSQDQPELACELATQALIQTCQAGEILSAAYARQALAGRQQRYPHLATLLGCGVNGALSDSQSELFSAAFSAVALPIRWKEIEHSDGECDWTAVDQVVSWAEQQKLVIRGGPLIDLGPDGLPQWLARWENDLFNLQSFVCDFVETAIARYIGKIRWWEVAARFNTGGALTLNEETRLALVARVLEVARQVDEEAQLIVRVDQPWGEYQARGQHRLSPLQIVDALLRSCVGLAGINLEIALGYLPTGTMNRDLMEFSRMIDQWSLLGVPLFLTLAVPSTISPDDATAGLEVDPLVRVSEAQQAEWIDHFLPLLLAKPAVAGVDWCHFSDGERYEFPHAGLLRPDGTPKPALESLLQFRHHPTRGM